MLELILANLRVRPFRTLISIVGVALGVVLVLLFTGLARGLTDDMAKRAANWKAEIVFTRPGSTGITSSNANVSTRYQERLLEIEGVKATVPVIRYISANADARWGIEQIDGLEWGPFSEMNGIGIVEGRAPAANDEVVVDERHLRDKRLTLGGTTEVFGKDYKIVGIFSPPSGSRIKLTLDEMQKNLEAPEMCTYILVKIDDGADPADVAARINEALPGNKVNLTRDLIIDAQDRVPGLNTFLQVLVGLGAFVSTIFVLLSMYTTITERRKEIGILKSLGASKPFIIRVIEGEALMIGVFGVIIGLAVSITASLAIEAAWELPFTFSPEWIATAIAIAIAGSLVGALYPAWRASDIDPVEVMVNE
ncbi:MAG: ABC transporter permease [Acidobacteriota bacterium]|nr:MAG: ABC transporter permease [Acidobacteriota bacterium]